MICAGAVPTIATHGRPSALQGEAPGAPGITRSPRQQPYVPGHVAPRRHPAADRRVHGLPPAAAAGADAAAGLRRRDRAADRGAVREQQIPTAFPARRTLAGAASWVARRLAPVRPGARSRAFSRENPRPRQRRAREPDRGAPGPIEPADRRRRASRQHRRQPWSERQRVRNGGAARAGPLYATPQAPPRPPQPNHTILFLSSDGGAFGGLGAEHFITHYRYRDRVVAVVDLDSIAGDGRPHLVFAGDDAANSPRPSSSGPPLRGSPSRPAYRADVAAPVVAAPRPGVPAQPVRAGAVRRARRSRPSRSPRPATARRRPSATRPTASNGARLTRIGRSGQALLESLDDDVELAEGTSSYVYLGARGRPRLGDRPDPVHRHASGPGGDRRPVRPPAPAGTFRSRPLCGATARASLFWVFAVLLFELFAFLGAWATGAAASARARAVSRNGVARARRSLVYGCLLALGWLFGRDRLVPRRPLGDGEELAGQVGALLALAVLSLLIVAMNPYAVIFVLPSLHAWIWLPQARNRPAPIQAGGARRRVPRAVAARRLVRNATRARPGRAVVPRAARGCRLRQVRRPCSSAARGSPSRPSSRRSPPGAMRRIRPPPNGRASGRRGD